MKLMQILKHEHNVYEFLSGKNTDYRGRTFEEILSKPDEWLEETHDYIQCIFPTDEPSQFVKAPLITKEEAEEMAKDPTVIENLKAAASRMQLFYDNNSHWIQYNNHNFRRISRILKCLELFGLEDEAIEFFKFAKDRIDITNLAPHIGNYEAAGIELSILRWRMICDDYQYTSDIHNAQKEF